MKTALLPLTLTMVLLVSLLCIGPAPVLATGFEVNNFFDDAFAHDVNPGDCVCADTYDQCTLRAATEEANACPGPDIITFKYAMTIAVYSGNGSFQLNETVTIDASSVWNSLSDEPGVIIDGGGGSFAGLYIGDDLCQIYGLYLKNFGGSGIYAVSTSNSIGGTAAGQRNVISGNNTAISLWGTLAQSNFVRNNYIGLTPAGDSKNANDTGVLIANGASNNVIGGSETLQANYISGNAANGVVIDGSGTDGNWIRGNAIGLSSDLSTGLGNGAHGVRIQNGPDDTEIGGASTLGNFIAGNAYSGIYVDRAGSGTMISHNLIGGNNLDGIHINETTGCLVIYNSINSNTQFGVRISQPSAAGNLIWPNSIFGNGIGGITLVDGANMGIAAPAIASATHRAASGTVACPGCTVALYSDSANQGQVYHGATTADGAGAWTYLGVLVGPNVTATTIDGSGNTSEFSAPYSIAMWNSAYVPLVVRNHP